MGEEEGSWYRYTPGYFKWNQIWHRNLGAYKTLTRGGETEVRLGHWLLSSPTLRESVVRRSCWPWSQLPLAQRLVHRKQLEVTENFTSVQSPVLLITPAQEPHQSSCLFSAFHICGRAYHWWVLIPPGQHSGKCSSHASSPCEPEAPLRWGSDPWRWKNNSSKCKGRANIRMAGRHRRHRSFAVAEKPELHSSWGKKG